MYRLIQWKLKCKLNVINTLKEKFNCDVGYSGHESGLAVFAASTMKISSLEDI